MAKNGCSLTFEFMHSKRRKEVIIMEKILAIPLTAKELQAVIDLMDYVLLDALTSGAKDEDEKRWAFDNIILEKLKTVQTQAQA